MSRASVRAQIVAYLAPEGQPSPITFLNAVNDYPPKVTQDDEFDLSDWGGSGAILAPFLTHQSERRIAVGGAHNGRKLRQYDVQLWCWFRSIKDKAEDAGLDFDVFMDSLTARLQADRNMGTASPVVGSEILPGMIFSAGEGDTYGGVDIVVDAYMPHLVRAGVLQTNAVVNLTVLEVLDT